MIRLALIVVMLTLVASCSGVLPKLSVTPVSADLSVGGEHETATDEDNVIKVQTGDSSNVKYDTETVEQVYNDISEVPTWLVLAFAFAVGIALPSPMAAWSSWRRRRELTKQITLLSNLLEKTK